MIRREDMEILAELDRIVARYGRDSVARLARSMRDPEIVADIAAMLEHATQRASATKRRSRNRLTTRVGMAVLNDLRKSDPRKHAVLAEMRELLVNGKLLGTMSELRRFAHAHDFNIGNASSRDKAIPPLLRSMSRLETDEIADLLDSLIQVDPNDRSLERWRNLIVKRRTW